MAPATKSRQPLSHEWRRHSLVKVRRPSWSGHATAATVSEGTSPQGVNATPQVSSQTTSSQTTADDIAW